MDTVTGKGGNVRVHVSLHVSVSCLLSGLFTSPPDYQHWQIYFFPSLVGVSACLLVCCPGWPFQLHASLSPRVPLLAARAKGESWACKEQCTPSAMFPILKLRLERWGYMAPTWSSHCDIAFVRKGIWTRLKDFLWGTLNGTQIHTNCGEETI